MIELLTVISLWRRIVDVTRNPAAAKSDELA